MSVSRFLPFPSVLTAALLLSACGDKAEKLRTYPLGEKVYLGHLVYTAFETQWLTQIPQDPLPRIPQSRFFLVRISAVNSGSDDLIVPGLSLEDDHGKTYEELTNGEGVPQWIGALRQVKPADSVAGNVVFDAPPGHYKMRVTDETSEKASLIDIPLTYGSETPEVPIPGSNTDKTKK
jgi:hypothetical protein